MWAALTEDVEGAPADDYPEDLDLDSKEEAELAKKREWHFEWLETVISHYGTNQKDDVYETIRRMVEWSKDPGMETKLKVNRWALSCSRAQNAVASEAWDAARVIRTSLRATLTVNPRRVSMGLSRLPSPVLSSTHACEWSWWRFTFRFLAFLATTVTLWIHFLRYGFKNATEHYSLCNLGNLLRQVLWVLLLSALREILELRTLRLSIYNRRCLTLASLFFTVVPVRVRGSHTYSADTTVD